MRVPAVQCQHVADRVDDERETLAPVFETDREDRGLLDRSTPTQAAAQADGGDDLAAEVDEPDHFRRRERYRRDRDHFENGLDTFDRKAERATLGDDGETPHFARR